MGVALRDRLGEIRPCPDRVGAGLAGPIGKRRQDVRGKVVAQWKQEGEVRGGFLRNPA